MDGLVVGTYEWLAQSVQGVKVMDVSLSVLTRFFLGEGTFKEVLHLLPRINKKKKKSNQNVVCTGAALPT